MIKHDETFKRGVNFCFLIRYGQHEKIKYQPDRRQKKREAKPPFNSSFDCRDYTQRSTIVFLISVQEALRPQAERETKKAIAAITRGAQPSFS
ncbi:hypothetical protein U2P60_08795 [Brucella sp. H1_1004]|uniref:hypothetical protein n=1 Tax=Brucella sp. H1_1004 TaxID=3110109 RepID=UPI0039B4EA42